ncbi:VIT family-domain-containing protein [Copromyces sp. CBS 386.78]|nr:VIT family-domain-containing protein [Copromyces sp. CBS 386.78]
MLSEKPSQAHQIPDRRRRSTNASSVTPAVTDIESQLLLPEEKLKPPPSKSDPLHIEKKKTERRSLSFQITPRFISDATIGLSDGLTVPFALTIGLSALGDTRVFIFGGLAELIAGAISMGLGWCLKAKSEA